MYRNILIFSNKLEHFLAGLVSVNTAAAAAAATTTTTTTTVVTVYCRSIS